MELQATIDKIQATGWRSTNEFVEAFHNGPTSESAAQSLHYHFGTGSTFISTRLLDIWMAQVPSETSETQLNMAITQKVAEVVKEHTRAESCLSRLGSQSGSDSEAFVLFTRHTIFYDRFWLREIEATYSSLLPCVTFLLHALLTEIVLSSLLSRFIN